MGKFTSGHNLVSYQKRAPIKYTKITPKVVVHYEYTSVLTNKQHATWLTVFYQRIWILTEFFLVATSSD